MKFEGTKVLPSLEFDEEKEFLKITGRSVSVTAIEDFWKPLLERIKRYVDEKRDMTVEISLEYFATASSKALLDLFKLFKYSAIEYKSTILVKWFYDDESLLEAGEDFTEMIPEINWKLIKI